MQWIRTEFLKPYFRKEFIENMIGRLLSILQLIFSVTKKWLLINYLVTKKCIELIIFVKSDTKSKKSCVLACVYSTALPLKQELKFLWANCKKSTTALSTRKIIVYL